MSEPRKKKRPTGDYDKGYCRPPKETQFRKGQPRPARKPKPETPDPTFEDYLAAELKKLIRIVEDGTEKYVTKGEALAKASIKGALIDNDPRRLKGFLPQPKVQEQFDFSEIDLTIVARFLAQMHKQQELPPSGDDDDAEEAAE